MVTDCVCVFVSVDILSVSDDAGAQVVTPSTCALEEFQQDFEAPIARW